MPRPCLTDHVISPMTCTLCSHCVRDDPESAALRLLWGEPDPYPTVMRPGTVVRSRMPLPCRFFGPATGEVRKCQECQTVNEVPLHTCHIHGQCTDTKLVTGVACCRVCEDRTKLYQIEVTADGIGDHILGLAVGASWLRNNNHSIRFVVRGAGYAWASLFHIPRLDLAIESYPHLPRAWSANNNSERHFVDACSEYPDLVAPQMAPIPESELAYAEQFRGVVVLAPWCAHAHREWPLGHWQTLEQLLNKAGIRTLVLGVHDAPASGFSATVLGARPTRVAAILSVASAFVGNESGLAHLAGAVGLRSLVLSWNRDGNRVHKVWTNTKVMQMSPNIITPSMVLSSLGEIMGNKPLVSSVLQSRSYGVAYYEEHRLTGLDYLGFGDWQRRYSKWLVDSLKLRDRRVLDVGCACGSILRGLGEAGAVVQGVDVNEHMIRLGREKWPDMASLMFVCDAVNLHIFDDSIWDLIHTAQVAEHWRPELVPFILRELARVTRPGGLLFCCLDTEELFARQNRNTSTEDPTHLCVRPMSWWYDELDAAGWEVCTSQYKPFLTRHPQSFLRQYDWDWFIARKQEAT